MKLTRRVLAVTIGLALADMAEAQECPAGSFGPTGQEPCELCGPGSYQPSAGQSSCLSAEPGYFAFGKGSQVQLACDPGSYQPNHGGETCLLAEEGHHVPDFQATDQDECLAGTFQNLPGQSTCKDAQPGFFTASNAAQNQSECPFGRFQPLSGKTSCNPAQPGFFVGATQAIQQEACEVGHFQPLAGQTTCLEARPGYHVAEREAIEQIACLPGTYQDRPGQSTCKDAQPGFFAGESASPDQTECPIGTFQPLPKQARCNHAQPGFFVGATQAIQQEACEVGHFQPLAGQTTCLEARPGYHVAGREAIKQTECLPGTYQDRPGQSTCKDAQPGFFAGETASPDQTECPIGTFQPLPKQARCNHAEAGFFVGVTQAIQQEACEAGHFQPNSGQTTCLEARPGFYVAEREAVEELACRAGSFQDLPGQSSCKSATPGHFVVSGGSREQEECSPGRFQPLAGQTHCEAADPGHFVNSPGSHTQQKCEIGTYQDLSGRTACEKAGPGFFVASAGATAAEKCPVGSVSYIESSACRSAPATGPDIVSPIFASNAGRGDPVRVHDVLTPMAVNPWVLNVRNLSNGVGFASPLTQLTLKSLVGKSSVDGTIGIPAFTPGTTLDEGENVGIALSLKPNRLGWLNFGLEVQTDEGAGLGEDGELFHLDFNISADGSDVAIGVLADRPKVAIDDPFTVWVDASNPGNAPSPTNLVTVGLPTGVGCNWQAHPEDGATGGSSALNNGQPQPVSLPPRSRMLYQGTCSADSAAAGPLVVSGTIKPDVAFDDLVVANNSDSTSITMGAAGSGRTGVSVRLVKKSDFLEPHSMQSVEYELHNEGPDPIVDGKFTLMLLGAAKYDHGSSSSTHADGSAGSGSGTDEGTPRQTSPLAQAIDFDYSLPVGASLQYSLILRSEFLESQHLKVIAKASLSPGWIQENSEGSVAEFTVSGGLFSDSFE